MQIIANIFGILMQSVVRMQKTNQQSVRLVKKLIFRTSFDKNLIARHVLRQLAW